MGGGEESCETSHEESRAWEEMASTVLRGFLEASRWEDQANWPAVKDALFGDVPRGLRWLVPPLARCRVRATLWARDVTRQGASALWSRFEDTLDALDARAPTEGFWLGAEVSRADLALGTQLLALCTSLTPWQAERVRGRLRLAAYLQRVVDVCAADQLS